MDEQVRITIGTGRDKIKEIYEEEGDITVVYEQGGQQRNIIVEKSLIRVVMKIIEGMQIGKRYASKFIYNRVITHLNIKSNIIMDRMPILIKTLKEHKLPEVTINNLTDELSNNESYSLMDFREFIGTRDAKGGYLNSYYFKVYGALKYLQDKNIILHNQRGSVFRLE